MHGEPNSCSSFRAVLASLLQQLEGDICVLHDSDRSLRVSTDDEGGLYYERHGEDMEEAVEATPVGKVHATILDSGLLHSPGPLSIREALGARSISHAPSHASSHSPRRVEHVPTTTSQEVPVSVQRSGASSSPGYQRGLGVCKQLSAALPSRGGHGVPPSPCVQDPGELLPVDELIPADIPLEVTPQLPVAADHRFGSGLSRRCQATASSVTPLSSIVAGEGSVRCSPSDSIVPGRRLCESRQTSKPSARRHEAEARRNSSRKRRSDISGVCTGQFQLEHAWDAKNFLPHRSPATLATLRRVPIGIIDAATEGESMSVRPYRWHTAIHPEAKLRLGWVFIGAMMLGYDAVVLPLMLAGLAPDNLEHHVVQWIFLTYWAIDIFVNFVTGVYLDGVIDLRLTVAAGTYLRGWFLNDLVIITIDAMVTILDVAMDSVNSSSPSIIRLIRSARLLRSLRLLRMMRFRRFMEIARRILDSCGSQLGVMIARVIGLMAAVILLNHTIACLWFYIGTSVEDPSVSWLSLVEGVESDRGYAYICAFHWAITQFTPATQNLAPRTSAERMFAIVVVLVALVTFSTFLGKMTSAMTQLLNLNADRFQKEATLRQFLTDNKISVSLAQYIWQVYRQQQESRTWKHKATLAEITRLMSLPTDTLKVLCLELYQKRLHDLPIFKKALGMNSFEAHDLCLALEERASARAKEIFPAGQAATSALGITYGKLSYSSHRLIVDVEAYLGMWISEAALWGSWKRCGTLTTMTVCRWLNLERKVFQDIVIGKYSGGRLRQVLSKYIELFAAEVIGHDWLDFPVDDCEFDALESIIHEAVLIVCGPDPLGGWPASRFGRGGLWSKHSLKNENHDIAEDHSMDHPAAALQPSVAHEASSMS